MSLYSEIEKLKSQIIDTERMLALVSDHPLMSLSLSEKLESLKERLSSLPTDLIEPKIRLLFSGNAVKGSMGIKSKFLSKTVKPIQELIKTQSALVRFGSVASRGQNKKSTYSELYLTALPTGSFGIELSQLETNDLFDENDMAKAIKQVATLIEATTESDAEFEKIIEDTPKRNLANLKAFLKNVADADSVLKLETGSFGINISKEEVKLGYDRVNSTIDHEEEIFTNGTLRGFLLDSGKFQFQNKLGESITGVINPEVPEETIIEYDHKFLNEECIFHLLVRKTIFISGTEKTTYELLGMGDAD